VGDAGANNMDISVDSKGNCRGSYSADGETVNFIQQGDVVYRKPEPGFWEKHFQEKGAQAEKFVNGRYVKTTSGDLEFAPLACATKMFSAPLFSEEAVASAQLTKGGENNVNGTRALQLKGALAGGPATVQVATTGEPYPLVADVVEDGKPTRLTFSAFGRPLPTDTPAPTDAVDALEVRKAIGVSD
jgi:hypothetical protein